MSNPFPNDISTHVKLEFSDFSQPVIAVLKEAWKKDNEGSNHDNWFSLWHFKSIMLAV